jgi:hypothetical protein
VSGQRKALIIANDEYAHDALKDLRAPGADAQALAGVLGDPQIGGFDRVQVVSNQPAHVMQAHIDDLFSDSRPDDVLLLYFSGHGLKDDSGELFFAGSETRPSRLASSAVPAQFVQGRMRATRSRSVVLLLDCCYSGAFGQGVSIRAGEDARVLDNFAQAGRGRAVITASTAMEYAFEGGELMEDRHQGPSVFTGVIVEGLRTGDADLDQDGRISLKELYTYVSEQVEKRNPHQTPSLKADLEGDLWIAQSQRRRIRPAPIPRALEDALLDEKMYTRLGAVTQLAKRVNSPDLPAAAGAYQALDRVARDDIEPVATEAAAAVAGAAVRPAETHLDLGTQRQGAEPVHHMIRLLGPPIAQACKVQDPPEWIGVNQTAEGLDIWIDTTAPGTFDGSITLAGITGTAEVTVAGKVIPPAKDRLSPGPALAGLLPRPPLRFTRSADTVALTGGSGDGAGQTREAATIQLRRPPAPGTQPPSAGGDRPVRDHRRARFVVLGAIVLLAGAGLVAVLPGLLSHRSTGSGHPSSLVPTTLTSTTPTQTATAPAVPRGDCATGSITLQGGAFAAITGGAAIAYMNQCKGAEIGINPKQNSNSAYGVEQLATDVQQHKQDAKSMIAMYDGRTSLAKGLTPDPVGLLVYTVAAHAGAIQGSAITVPQLQQLYAEGGLPGKIGVSLSAGSGSRQALLALWQEAASGSPVPNRTCVDGVGPAPLCLAGSYSDAIKFVDSTKNSIAYMAVDRVSGDGHPSIIVNVTDGPASIIKNQTYTSDPQTSVISIKKTPTAQAVAPTVENAINGTYSYTAVEHLYLPPGQSPLSQKFVAYLQIYLKASHFNDFAACSAKPSLAKECAAQR